VPLFDPLPPAGLWPPAALDRCWGVAGRVLRRPDLSASSGTTRDRRRRRSGGGGHLHGGASVRRILQRRLYRTSVLSHDRGGGLSLQKRSPVAGSVLGAGCRIDSPQRVLPFHRARPDGDHATKRPAPRQAAPRIRTGEWHAVVLGIHLLADGESISMGGAERCLG